MSGGLGYARMSLIMGAAPGESRYDAAPPADVTNDDFEAVSLAVEALGASSASLIVAVYVHGCGKPVSRVAREQGVHHETMKRRLTSIWILLQYMVDKQD